MTGLFDGKMKRDSEIVTRDEILETVIEYFEEGESFEKFVKDTMDLHDISEEDLRKILHGEIKEISTNTYDL